jgi:hypothetical protein
MKPKERTMKNGGKVTGYTSDRPSFATLADLREKAKKLPQLIEDLAEGEDVIQRATDLHCAAYNFLEKVCEVVEVES